MAWPHILSLRQLTRLFVGCLFATMVLATLLLQHSSRLNWIINQDVLAPPSHVSNHPYFNYSLDESEPPGDASQACRLPRVHPFHPSLWRRHIPPFKPIVCNSRQPSLTYVDKTGRLRFNDTELTSSGYGPPDNPSVECSWQLVLRPPGDDLNVQYGDPIPLTASGQLLAHDYVLVRCYRPQLLGLLRVEVYSAFHVNAVAPAKLPKSHQAKPINVVVLGVDSMSRLSFIRFLPRTYKYLTEVMNAHVFRGMNKVADNTFPNLLAILTGREAYGKRLPMSVVVDHNEWPLIWKDYSREGYSTLFDEDFPEFNMFNYLSTGFRNQPTDHYMRPFWLAVQSSKELRTSGHLCLGAKPRHQYQLDHLLSYLRRQNGTWTTPGFAFSFLAEVTHEYLSRAAAADADFESFLKAVVNEGLLGNDTYFAFISDHGHRFDAIRETPVGRLEERMPFFAMVHPKSLGQDLRKNLVANTGRLVSPFDHHATLLDILSHVTNGSELGTTTTELGRSLFTHIPTNRTCADAGIPEFYCACGTDVDATPMTLDPRESSRLADSAGRAVIERVNWLIRQDGQARNKCAELTLKEVKSLQRIGDSQLKLAIMLEAGPSGALFEANVERTNENEAFEVAGDVSRINKYKGQSECVNNAVLRKYCYCNT